MQELQAPTTSRVFERTGAGARTRHGAGDRAFHWAVIALLVVLVASMIIPFLNVLSVAFSAPLASMEHGIVLWPRDFSAEGFKTVWVNLDLQRAFMNSVIVTAAGTFFHVTLCCLAAYVLIQRDLPGRALMLGFILATMAIPSELIMIPLYIVNKDLGLLNSLWALIFAGMVSGFSILLLRNFFASVPYDLAESAKIDGASDF
jgi:putative aldouronate transport system permease protein